MEKQTPLKKEEVDPFNDVNTRITRNDFCDDLVSIVLKDIIDHPEKYQQKQVFFVGVNSPLDYCAVSLRGLLLKRGIGGVNVGTADCVNGPGNYFDVDDYLRQRFAGQRSAQAQTPSRPYPFYLDGESSVPTGPLEEWTLD